MSNTIENKEGKHLKSQENEMIELAKSARRMVGHESNLAIYMFVNNKKGFERQAKKARKLSKEATIDFGGYILNELEKQIGEHDAEKILSLFASMTAPQSLMEVLLHINKMKEQQTQD